MNSSDKNSSSTSNNVNQSNTMVRPQTMNLSHVTTSAIRTDHALSILSSITSSLSPSPLLSIPVTEDWMTPPTTPITPDWATPPSSPLK